MERHHEEMREQGWGTAFRGRLPGVRSQEGGALERVMANSLSFEALTLRGLYRLACGSVCVGQLQASTAGETQESPRMNGNSWILLPYSPPPLASPRGLSNFCKLPSSLKDF